jgi:hypothetical protein
MAVTLTGKLVNIIGADAAEEGSIVISLCGYGSQVPIVPGSGIIGRLTTLEVDADASGDVTAELWGNDKISPAGTYYTVTVKDSNGDIMQVNAYVFQDGQSYDLGEAPPFDPNQPPPWLRPIIVNQLLLIAFSQTPNFPGDQYTAWGIQLTGDVTSSTTSNTVAGNLYTFIISQDATGDHEFVWPPNVFNATPVNPAPSGITIQTFVCLANNGPMLPIGPATYYNQ